MGTIAEKLTYLDGTKTAIKNAIIAKGVSVGENDTFRSYATKIGNISTLKGQTKTVNPSTVQQVITPDTGYNALTQVTLNPVTNAIDANITAGNIKKDVTILGVTGTLESGTDTSDATATAGDILLNKTAYVNGQKLTGTVGTESKTVKSTTSSQTIIPTSGKLINEVVVNPITLNDLTIQAEGGTRTYYPASNVDGFSGVTVTTDYGSDPNIIPENIKEDVEILGMVGTFQGYNLKSINTYPDTNSLNQGLTGETMPVGSPCCIQTLGTPFTIQNRDPIVALYVPEEIEMRDIRGDMSEKNLGGFFNLYNQNNIIITGVECLEIPNPIPELVGSRTKFQIYFENRMEDGTYCTIKIEYELQEYLGIYKLVRKDASVYRWVLDTGELIEKLWTVTEDNVLFMPCNLMFIGADLSQDTAWGTIIKHQPISLECIGLNTGRGSTDHII